MTRKFLSFLGSIALIGLTAFTFATVGGCQPAKEASPTVATASTPTPKKAAYEPAGPEIATYRAKGLPMVLDFGKGWCKPCKAMAPDLEALHTELAGKVLVRFNDLEKEMALAEELKIRIMPTQVYLDGQGKEVHRNEGYASKADMLAKMKELMFLQ